MRYDAPVIITGCPRSGTTGLQVALSAIDGGCVWFEFMLYSPNRHPFETVMRRGDDIAQGNEPYDPAPDKLINHNAMFYRNPLVRHIGLRKVLTGVKRGWTPQQVREYLFDTAVEHRGLLRVYGDKTPLEYSCSLPETLQNWPKAKVLFAVRDGRDVAASHERGKTTAPKGARLWLSTMKTLERDMEQMPAKFSKRVRVVKFEEAAVEKVRVFREIADFLGFAATAEDEPVWKHTYHPRRIGKWKETCPNVESEAGDEFVACLRRWGYA